MASKNVFQNISHQLQTKRAIYSIALSSEVSTPHRLTSNETIIFSLDKSMLLTDIICSKVLRDVYTYTVVDRTFKMSIEQKPSLSAWYPQTLYEATVNVNNGRNHVKLATPLVIKSGHVYAISFKSNIIQDSPSLYTYGLIGNNTEVELAPNVNISFGREDKSDKSLISYLYFTHLIDN